MTPETKIIQVFTRQWTNKEGQINTEVGGLGDDGLIYRWHRGSGKWILDVIAS